MPDANSTDGRESFFAMKTRDDLAAVLGETRAALMWHAFRSDPGSRYRSFEIPKKSGGLRQIEAPGRRREEIQRKIVNLLTKVYQPRACVTGFVPKGSIVVNARRHRHRAWVLNMDIEDFFPSINFGRVLGLLEAKPYLVPREVATVVASICTHDNHLPQGAPTSPIISNMICARMDSELLRFARLNRASYSRYADDITFSVGSKNFPPSIAAVNGTAVQLDPALEAIFVSNGFQINAAKTRLSHRTRRQMVTGLIVNERVNVRRKYIRQISAMIHAWEKYTLAGAQKEFESKWDHKATRRAPFLSPPKFDSVVAGKLAFLKMVRGKKDRIYARLFHKYQALMKAK